MINLHYIRAAIEQDTGIRISLERTRELLVEEGLITQSQADNDAQIITSYAEYFGADRAERPVEEVIDTEMGLPD